MRSWLCSMIVLLGVACTADPGDVGAGTGELVVTDRCEVAGFGTLPVGDFLAGTVRGGDTGATGSWAHVADRDVVIADPDWIFCRINGSVQGDFGGTARINRRSGYTYRVHVQDVGDPGPPTLTPGTPSIQTVSATRRYRPTRWEDGSLTIEDRALVTIPSELPVTVGNAGNQWAWITFRRSETFDTVVCRYRGGAHNPNPCTPEDLTAGESYVFDRCTGELEGTPEVEAGDVVDVRSMTVHVQTGAHFLPTRDAAQTTITVDFEVTPLVPETRRDFYRIAVWEDATGTQVLFREGELAIGNLRILRL